LKRTALVRKAKSMTFDDAMPEPTAKRYIAQRLSLNYLDWGNPDAPPLLLVHGGRDHARSWDWAAQRLRANWHVIAPDLRGHGDSDWVNDGDYQLMDMAHDLAELIDQLGLAPVTLVGHSMGGIVCTRMAGLFPEQVSRLVSIEGLGFSRKARADYDAVPMREQYRQWVARKRGAAGKTPRIYATLDDAIARMREANAHLSEDQLVHLTRHGVKAWPEGGYMWKYDPGMAVHSPYDLRQSEIEALWEAITCRVLLCYGTKSWALSPDKDGRTDHFRSARVALFEGAGHWLHHDQFEAFMAELEAFLSEGQLSAI
jgi:pimeloyl-ACP methyl ester carboxylesterase